MAQVGVSQELNHRIDLYLRLLREEWERVPDYVAEWATWTEDQRLAFVTEWSVNTDQLAQLRDWAERGLLDSDQLHRLEQLEALIARRQPLLDPLIDE